MFPSPVPINNSNYQNQHNEPVRHPQYETLFVLYNFRLSQFDMAPRINHVLRRKAG